MKKATSKDFYMLGVFIKTCFLFYDLPYENIFPIKIFCVLYNTMLIVLCFYKDFLCAFSSFICENAKPVVRPNQPNIFTPKKKENAPKRKKKHVTVYNALTSEV